MEKVYELTTNARDGFAKWYVRGIKNDKEALRISKAAFGKYASPTLISYYDNYPSRYGTDWKRLSSTIKMFMKITKVRYR